VYSDSLRDPEQLRRLLDAVLAIECDLELPRVLRRVVEAACGLTGARYGALGVLAEDRASLAAFVHVGVDEETAAAIGALPRGEGILGLLIEEPRPLRLADLSCHPASVGFPPGHPPMSSFLGAPIRIGDEVFGNLYLTEKTEAAEFSADDESLIVALASAAAVMIEKARLQARVTELQLVSERERMARDLHDTVLQRLFAIGLSLQSGLPLISDAAVRSRVEEAITDLDDTIYQVRTTIFALEPPPAAARGLRSRVVDLCSEARRSLGFEPALSFRGPVDSTVPERIQTELLAALREALSNVARHAKANRVEIILAVETEVHLRVVDDGVGIDLGAGVTGHGLPNMAERAKSLGGSFQVASRPEGGTELSWRVPLSS
jgi:signal transduction histidine kinase